MAVTVADLRDPPLPDDASVERWRTYLTLWSTGRRPELLAAARAFVDTLESAGAPAGRAFAAWWCELAFDRGRYSGGQWGGGLSPGRDGWDKPAEFALTVHPIPYRAVLPYVLDAVATARDRRLRWAAQFAAGHLYRLPPEGRGRLRDAITTRCGPEVEPAYVSLLRLADADPPARRLLAEALEPD